MTLSTLMERSVRPPNADERAAMVTLSKSLTRAYVPGSSVAKVAKRTPPGTLEMRELIAAHQQRSVGARVTAKPFIERRITHNPKAQLKIAFGGDVSGSMGSLATALAVTRWMISEAGYRVQAKVGAALFGSGVIPIQRPGQRVTMIEPWSACDATEHIASCWAFLDNKMQMLQDKRSARFVFWFTDFELVDVDQATAFHYAMQEARRAGVHIIGVVPTPSDLANAGELGIEHTVVINRRQPSLVATDIGQTLLDAVRLSRR